MKCYIAITDEENWKIILSKNMYGVSERHKKVYNAVNIGDKLIFYVKPKRVSGVFEICSKINDPRNNWGLYVHQMNLKPIKVLDRLLVLELDFINSLDLFKNKLWGPTLNGKALLEITKNDFDKFYFLF
jgi:predicted RNA-binding protein